MPSDFNALVPLLPPKYGLLSVANKAVDNGDGEGDRWENGFQFWPDTCNHAGGVTWSCPAQGGAQPTVPASPAAHAVENFTPYTALVGYKCAPVGMGLSTDPEERATWFRERAARAVDACLSNIMEKELWDGAAATSALFPNRYLNNNALVVKPAGFAALGYVTALAEMEQGLADCSCGGEHTIHAQYRTVVHLMSAQLIRLNGFRLETLAGTRVSMGAGYPGSGPNGEPTGHANHSWMFGTSLVSTFTGGLRMLPDRMDEAINKQTNLVEFRAERTVAAVWDGCCHVGIKVDHTTARTSSGS